MVKINPEKQGFEMPRAYLSGFKGSAGNDAVKLLKRTYRRLRRETCNTNAHC